jgi:hypothetical protein
LTLPNFLYFTNWFSEISGDEHLAGQIKEFIGIWEWDFSWWLEQKSFKGISGFLVSSCVESWTQKLCNSLLNKFILLMGPWKCAQKNGFRDEKEVCGNIFKNKV